MATSDNDKSRLDEAARAGWLYFIAGHTQDEIARMLQVSRASAQRLVSLCLAERLITFRLEHPITACMELAALWNFRSHFLAIVIISFLLAGLQIPDTGPWLAARWFVLSVGAVAGFVAYMKAPGHRFSAFH